MNLLRLWATRSKTLRLQNEQSITKKIKQCKVLPYLIDSVVEVRVSLHPSHSFTQQSFWILVTNSEGKKGDANQNLVSMCKDRFVVIKHSLNKSPSSLSLNSFSSLETQIKRLHQHGQRFQPHSWHTFNKVRLVHEGNRSERTLDENVHRYHDIERADQRICEDDCLIDAPNRQVQHSEDQVTKGVLTCEPLRMRKALMTCACVAQTKTCFLSLSTQLSADVHRQQRRPHAHSRPHTHALWGSRVPLSNKLSCRHPRDPLARNHIEEWREHRVIDVKHEVFNATWLKNVCVRRELLALRERAWLTMSIIIRVRVTCRWWAFSLSNLIDSQLWETGHDLICSCFDLQNLLKLKWVTTCASFIHLLNEMLCILLLYRFNFRYM